MSRPKKKQKTVSARERRRARKWTESRLRINGEIPEKLLPVRKLNAKEVELCSAEIRRRQRES